MPKGALTRGSYVHLLIWTGYLAYREMAGNECAPMKRVDGETGLEWRGAGREILGAGVASNNVTKDTMLQLLRKIPIQ